MMENYWGTSTPEQVPPSMLVFCLSTMTFMYIVKLAWGIEKRGEAEIIYNYTNHVTQAKILKEVKGKEMIVYKVSTFVPKTLNFKLNA